MCRPDSSLGGWGCGRKLPRTKTGLIAADAYPQVIDTYKAVSICGCSRDSANQLGLAATLVARNHLKGVVRCILVEFTQ